MRQQRWPRFLAASFVTFGALTRAGARGYTEPQSEVGAGFEPAGSPLRWLTRLRSAALLCILAAAGIPTSAPAAPPSEVQLDLTAFQGDASVVLPGTIGFLAVSGATSYAIDVVATGNVTDVLWSATAPASTLTLEKNLHGILSVQGTLKGVTILGNILEGNTILIDVPVEFVFIGENTSQPIIISADVGELQIAGNVNDTITINGPATVGAIVIEGNLNDDITVGSGATVNTIFIAGNFTGGAEIIVEDGGYVGVVLVGGESNGESEVPPQPGEPACVTNHAPVASAVAAPPSPSVGTVVTLDAAGSTDPDLGDTLAFKWSVVSAPEPVVFNPDDVSPLVTFTPSTPGTYDLRLTASDLCGFVDTALPTVQAATPGLRALVVSVDIASFEVRGAILDFSSIPPILTGSTPLPLGPGFAGVAAIPGTSKALALMGTYVSLAVRLDVSSDAPVLESAPIQVTATSTAFSSKSVTPDGLLAVAGGGHPDQAIFLSFIAPLSDPLAEAFPPLPAPLGSSSFGGGAITNDGQNAVVCWESDPPGFSVVDLSGAQPSFVAPEISLGELGGTWSDVAIIGTEAIFVRADNGDPDDPVQGDILRVDLPTRTVLGAPEPMPFRPYLLTFIPGGVSAVVSGKTEGLGERVVAVVDLGVVPHAVLFQVSYPGTQCNSLRPTVSPDGTFALVPQFCEGDPSQPGLLLIDLQNLGAPPIFVTQAADGTDLTWGFAATFLP